MLDTLYILDRTLSATHPTFDMSPPSTCSNPSATTATTTTTTTTTNSTSLPSYLQVIQLVEVPTPSAEQLKGSASYSSSHFSSSYDASSSYTSSSTLSSTSPSLEEEEEEDESYCTYCSTSLEAEAPNSTGGTLDVECDRVRLSRISAWSMNVPPAPTISHHAGDEGHEAFYDRLNWAWTCSACDRWFEDERSLGTHPTEDVCRAAVEYALSSK